MDTESRAMDKVGNQGWILLHRKIREHWLYKVRRVFSKFEAWIDLLLLSNHDEEKVAIGNRVILIPRGALLTSVKKLAARWRWSRHKVDDFLNALKQDTMLDTKKDTYFTVISVLNYDLYQKPQHQKGLKKDIKKDINGTQTNKEKEETKEEPKPYQAFLSAWNSTTALPAIQHFSNSRQEKFRQRMKESVFAERWPEIIEKLSRSAFCAGKGDRGWRVNVDWLLGNDTNYVKVLEGKYDDATARPESTAPLVRGPDGLTPRERTLKKMGVQA
jgi:hypothetical protein